MDDRDEKKFSPIPVEQIRAKVEGIMNGLLAEVGAEVPLAQARIVIGGMEIWSDGLRAMWRPEWCQPGNPWPERMVVSVPDLQHPIYGIGYSRPTLDIEVQRIGTSAAGEPIYWDARVGELVN